MVKESTELRFDPSNAARALLDGRGTVSPQLRQDAALAMEAAVGARLELARNGYSFRDLARMTGCNPESVRRYHRTGQPSFEYILRLCPALGISPNWLMSGVGAPMADDPVNRLLKDATEAELFDALSQHSRNREAATLARAEQSVRARFTPTRALG